MLVNEAISIAQNLTGNAVDQSNMLRWLSELDGQIAFEVYEAPEWSPYTEEDLTTALLVPFPYDKLYIPHLEAMIYYTRGEYDRYDNSRAMREAFVGEFRRFVQRTKDCCGHVTIRRADGGSGSVVDRFCVTDAPMRQYVDNAIAAAIQSAGGGVQLIKKGAARENYDDVVQALKAGQVVALTTGVIDDIYWLTDWHGVDEGRPDALFNFWRVVCDSNGSHMTCTLKRHTLFYMVKTAYAAWYSTSNVVVTREVNGSVSMENGRITGLASPTAGTDAATKQYVDDKIDELRQMLGLE